RGEIALGDAEGHFDALGLAPLCDEPPAAYDEPARPTARKDCPQHSAGALGLVGDADEHAASGDEVAAPPCLVRVVVGERSAGALRTQARLGRRRRRPAARSGDDPRGVAGGQSHARATATPIGHATPVPPWPQYPHGFLLRYCW